MRRLSASVVLAWIFCIIVSAVSLIYAGQTLVQGLPANLPYKLAIDMVFALQPIFFAFPAALIILRQPRNTVGWLMMILPLATVPNNLMVGYLSTFKAAPPPATFLNLVMAHFTADYWVALIMPLLMIPLFFPTGRLLSPRWRWTVYLAAGMCLVLVFWSCFTQEIQPSYVDWKLINPIGFISNQMTQTIDQPWLVALGVLTVTSLVSIVVRFRRAVTVEREQMKWLLYACAVFVLIYLPGLFLITGKYLPQYSFFTLLFSLSVLGFPAAITIAILRYRLFDIDVIIRKTLVYVILTGLLGLVYFGGIVSLQQVFRTLTGQSTEAAVVITTLTIAALFTPLRRRIQAIIDRRFFRQKFNTDKALAQFAVAASSSANLDSLTIMLVDIIQETLQPTQVNLYLFRRK